MELELQKTEDGSHTLFWKEKNEHYHSVHGSVNEAMVVYINATLIPLLEMAKLCGLKELRIFEMGFGTGLNTLLSLATVENWVRESGYEVQVEYTSLEYNPLDRVIWSHLNHPIRVHALFQGSDLDFDTCFKNLHEQGFENIFFDGGVSVQPSIKELAHQSHSTHFSVRKLQGDMAGICLPSCYFHGVFYDAFAPTVQPELWEPEIFQKLYESQVPSDAYSPQGNIRLMAKEKFPFQLGSILSTYCAKGKVKRDLRQAGYQIEVLPGPVGKREITRAFVQ